MGLTQLLIFLTSLALIAAGVMFYWWRRDLVSLRRNTDERGELQRKLEAARSELGEIKEENRKRRAELVEAREQARKTKKKRGHGEAEAEAAAPANAEVERLMDEIKKLNAALQGAEARVQRVQDEKAAAIAEAQRSAEAASRQAAAAQFKVAEDRHAALEAELKDLRAQLTRASSETPPADVRVSLDGVAPELVAELRRFYKRASNNEKLYLQARGKVEALSDRLAETTRRYNAVCRELALAAGRSIPAGDEGDRLATRVAQDVVTAAEEVVRRRKRKPRPRRADREGGADGAHDDAEGEAPDDATAGATRDDATTAAEAATPAPEAAADDGSDRVENAS